MDSEKLEKIQIINIRNILSIVGIGVILVGIFLNENFKRVILNEEPFISADTANDIDVIADIVTIAIAVIAYIVVNYIYSKKEDGDPNEGDLQLLAAFLGIIIALLFIYIDTTYPTFNY